MVSRHDILRTTKSAAWRPCLLTTNANARHPQNSPRFPQAGAIFLPSTRKETHRGDGKTRRTARNRSEARGDLFPSPWSNETANRRIAKANPVDRSNEAPHDARYRRYAVEWPATRQLQLAGQTARGRSLIFILPTEPRPRERLNLATAGCDQAAARNYSSARTRRTRGVSGHALLDALPRGVRFPTGHCFRLGSRPIDRSTDWAASFSLFRARRQSAFRLAPFFSFLRWEQPTQ